MAQTSVGTLKYRMSTSARPLWLMPFWILCYTGVDGGQKPRIFGEYPVPSGAAPAKTKGGPP
ncbi:MAG: hypothetical protein AB2813_01995, partial [Candidatus Sedimenticola endophacoides]